MRSILVSLLFCFLLGLGGLAVAGWLVATGDIIESTDNLFLVLVALLFALACFSYIAWHLYSVMSEGGGKKKGRR